jgi:hypothetical protein
MPGARFRPAFLPSSVFPSNGAPQPKIPGAASRFSRGVAWRNNHGENFLTHIKQLQKFVLSRCKNIKNQSPIKK